MKTSWTTTISGLASKSYYISSLLICSLCDSLFGLPSNASPVSQDDGSFQSAWSILEGKGKLIQIWTVYCHRICEFQVQIGISGKISGQNCEWVVPWIQRWSIHRQHTLCRMVIRVDLWWMYYYHGWLVFPVHKEN